MASNAYVKQAECCDSGTLWNPRAQQYFCQCSSSITLNDNASPSYFKDCHIDVGKFTYTFGVDWEELNKYYDTKEKAKLAMFNVKVVHAQPMQNKFYFTNKERKEQLIQFFGGTVVCTVCFYVTLLLDVVCVAMCISCFFCICLFLSFQKDDNGDEEEEEEEENVDPNIMKNVNAALKNRKRHKRQPMCGNKWCFLKRISLKHKRVPKPLTRKQHNRKIKQDTLKEVKQRLRKIDKKQAILHYFNTMTMLVMFC